MTAIPWFLAVTQVRRDLPPLSPWAVCSDLVVRVLALNPGMVSEGGVQPVDMLTKLVRRLQRFGLTEELSLRFKCTQMSHRATGACSVSFAVS